MVVLVSLMHDGRRGEGKGPVPHAATKGELLPSAWRVDRARKEIGPHIDSDQCLGPTAEGRKGERARKRRFVGRTDGWKGHGEGQARQVEGRSQVHTRTDQCKGERVNDKENT